MLIAGLKLMVIGMLTVMIFLVIMVLLILLTAKLTKKITQRELESIEEEKQKKALQIKVKRDREKAKVSQHILPPAREEVPMSVISAAVTAYEVEKGVK